MKFLVLTLLLFAACDATQGQTAPNLELCANRYGEQISCGDLAGSSDSGLSGPVDATLQASASVLVNIVKQWGTVSNAFAKLDQEEAQRQQRYAPPSYVQLPPTSPEEREARIKRAQQETADWIARDAKKNQEARAEEDRQVRASWERSSQRSQEYTEALLAASKARIEATQDERAKAEQDVLDLRERAKGNFPQADIKGYREGLERALFHQTDIQMALRELNVVRRLGEESESIQGQNQIRELLAEFVNDDGLVKSWVADFPELREITLTTPAKSTERKKVIEAINRALMYHALNEVQNGGHERDISSLLIETALKADVVFGVSQSQGERLLARGNRRYYFAINDPNMKKWYASQQMPQVIESELGLAGVSPDTFIGHEIIYTAQMVAKNLKVLDDDVNRFLIGTSFHQASVFASQNLIRESLAMLDRVVAVVDFAVGLVPFVGDFKDICEAVTGAKMCLPGGEVLDTQDRIFSAMGVVVGSGAMWKGAGKVLKGAVADALIFGEEQELLSEKHNPTAHLYDHVQFLTPKNVEIFQPCSDVKIDLDKYHYFVEFDSAIDGKIIAESENYPAIFLPRQFS